MPKVSRKPRRPSGVTLTAWLRFILSIQPRSKYDDLQVTARRLDHRDYVDAAEPRQFLNPTLPEEYGISMSCHSSGDRRAKAALTRALYSARALASQVPEVRI